MAAAAAAAPPASSFAAHLAALSPAACRSLYADHPHVAMAAMQSLPPLAQMYCMRLAMHDGAVARQTVDGWPTEGPRAPAHVAAIAALERLHVLAPETDRVRVALADGVRKHIRNEFAGGAAALDWSDDDHEVPSTSGKRKRDSAADPPPRPSRKELAAVVRDRWEGVLLLLASDGSGGDGSAKHAEVEATRELLIDAGLVDAETGVCSPEGLRFLLCPPRKQLWRLLGRLLREQSGEDVANALALLARLSAIEPGRLYRASSLGHGERSMLPRVALLGLVWSAQGKWFCATSLARELVSGGLGDDADDDGGGDNTAGASGAPSVDAGSAGAVPHDGYILVESNFRVYSYYRSALEEMLVHLFCQPEVKLPNLFVSIITRESVTRALDYGASANLILSFLTTNAHPRTRLRHGPAVPECVSDAIRLWEAERQRVTSERGYLYSQFDSLVAYERFREHARGIGGLLWSHAGEGGLRYVCVAERYHDAMRAFVQEERERAAAGE